MNAYAQHRLRALVAGVVGLWGMVTACAQTPVLIKELVSREYSIHVGGVQTPEIKDVVSREVSLFILNGPADPYHEVVSREVSLAVVTPEPPPRVAIIVRPSVAGDRVELDWSAYNQWAVGDVARFDVYLADHPFTSVAGMEPRVSVPGERTGTVLTNLPTFRDHFIAVVAVDALGNFDPAVPSAGAYVISPEVVSREVSLFVGSEPNPPYREVVSREVSLVVTTPEPPSVIAKVATSGSPSGAEVTLDWSAYNQWAERDVAGFDIYFSDRAMVNVAGMTPYASAGGEARSITLTGLPEFRDHFFAVVPVDGLGNANPAVNYAGHYVISQEVVSREVSLFVGGEPASPYREVVSREYSIVVPDTAVPAPVTGLHSGFLANTSSTSEALDIDWSSYNEVAQRDVVRYRIYVATSFFDNVAGMEPVAFVANGTQRHTLTGLVGGNIYHVAVVAEDALGQFDPQVRSFSVQASLADRFADRTVFTEGSFSGTVQNVAATREAGEPRHAGKVGGKSLWLTWRAPATGVATFRTTGSAIDTLLAVYRGTTVTGLTEVASDEDRGGFLTSELRFNAVAGTDYQIAVDGFAAEGGDIVLAWELLPTANQLPVFDTQPESRVAVAGENVTLTAAVTPANSTLQWFLNGQPLPGATTATLQLSAVTAEQAGTYRLRVTAPNGLSAESRDALVEVTEAAGPVTLSADKLEDLFADDAGAGVGLVRAGQPRRQSFTSVSAGSLAFNTLGSFARTNEPILCGGVGGASRWFRFRFQSAGEVVMATTNTAFDSMLAVFTNRSDLRLVACNDDVLPGLRNSRVRFTAVPGVDYLVVVDGKQGAAGACSLTWKSETLLFAGLEDATVPELALYTQTLTASAPGGRLPEFTLVSGPAGAGVTNGVFGWVPTEAQGPSTNVIRVAVSDGVASVTNTFTVLVTEVNRPPELAAVADQTVTEGSLLSLTLTGSDADEPAQPLVFTLVSGPASAGVTNGVFGWVPTEAQGPSTNVIRVAVSDGVASVTNAFTVLVSEVNRPPELAAVADQTVTEGSLLSLTLAGSDADEPAQPLVFTLVSGPNGAGVTNGVFGWVAAAGTAGTTNAVAVSVSDGIASVSSQFRVVVRPAVLAGPELAGVRVDPAGATLGFVLRGEPGTAYQLERTTDFSAWVLVRRIVLEQGEVPIDVPLPAAEAAGFYRVRPVAP